MIRSCSVTALRAGAQAITLINIARNNAHRQGRVYPHAAVVVSSKFSCARRQSIWHAHTPDGFASRDHLRLVPTITAPSPHLFGFYALGTREGSTPVLRASILCTSEVSNEELRRSFGLDKAVAIDRVMERHLVANADAWIVEPGGTLTSLDPGSPVSKRLSLVDHEVADNVDLFRVLGYAVLFDWSEFDESIERLVDRAEKIPPDEAELILRNMDLQTQLSVSELIALAKGALT